MFPAAVLLSAIALLMGWEYVSPRAGRRPERGVRWASHAVLGIIGFGAGRLITGAGLASVALWAGQQGVGLFNALAIHPLVEASAAIALLDFVLWLQHWAMHKVPLLWRFHRVHHSDSGLDVTSAWRFHPGEMMLSLGIKAAAVALLGASPVAVVAFELILAASAMFNHAHLRLPHWLDSALSLLIVTPDMHRVHHGREGGLDQKNFGFFLNIWDKLAKRHTRLDGPGTDALGLGAKGIPAERSLLKLLAQPKLSP